MLYRDKSGGCHEAVIIRIMRYFPYADSSIIYEVAREDGWFTVLSYKTMNRICYRFIASPYRPELFIDEEGACLLYTSPPLG